MRSGNFITILLASIFVVLMVSAIPAHAAKKVPVTADQVVRAVTNADVTKSAVTARLASGGRFITINTFRDENAQDSDCKINAVLIGKEVTDAWQDVHTVRIVFFDRKKKSRFWYVDVQRTVIDAFAAGKVNDEQLLSMISLIEGKRSYRSARRTPGAAAGGGIARGGNTLDTYLPVAGTHLDDRKILLAQIRKFKGMGGNADPFFRRLVSIDRDHIKKNANDSLVVSMLQGLADNLEQAVKLQYARIKSNPGAAAVMGGPKQGPPFYQRRCYVYKKINDLQSAGKGGAVLAQLKSTFEREIEARVGKPGSEPAIDRSLKFIENKLRYIR